MPFFFRALSGICATVGTAIGILLGPAMAQSPSPNYKVSSTVVPGHYACLEFRGSRPVEFGQYTGTRFSNEFDIVDASRYEYRGSRRQPGAYSFSASTGAITWTSGPFAPDADGTSVEAVSTVRASDGRPAIILTFKIPGLGESREFCALVR
ncbi:hypothetical protein [Azospirillum sp. SYSU D00513]|uniref:hypothetical protein n=1 Tax=Azospirillum sp. SYSU D00513 TaxID=2812561 RepID=UPI001A965CCB|nr:hypothetical protein [Azospirillum sp. SYSU D00513]